MMRIIVAGGGGLGYLLATQLSQAANAYNVVVLSRWVWPSLLANARRPSHVNPAQARPEFSQLDVQLHVVDYNDQDCLTFALQGMDLVISTISGREQMSLIDAAVRGRVRVFVPSEFEGCLSQRPAQNDPLDRGSSDALALLRYWAQQSRIKYTVFSCGLFMERFHPFGLSYLNIGHGSGVSNAGDYLVDINKATAEYTDRDSRGRTVRICLSSVVDVGRFLVAAIDLGIERWPDEFTMRGDRMSLSNLAETCSRARNGLTASSAVFHRQMRSYADLQTWLSYYMQTGDVERVAYYQRLLATANGRYDFGRATLNEAIERSDLVNVQPLRLSQWLGSVLQYV